MEKNKSEQYTYGPEEKEILEILSSFENELNEKLEESKSEVQRVKYYEKFCINGIDFKNIFISTEKDAYGKVSYHVYCGDSSNEILLVDSEGNLKIINSELEKFLGEVDLEKTMEENEQNKERLKGISEIESQDKILENANKEQQEENEEEQKQEDDVEEIEENLEEQGQDLQISKYKKIKDSHISEKMPEVFKTGEENGLAFSKKLNRFVIISKVNGQYQMNENIEPAKITMKSVISISPDGEQVEKKVPHSLMKVPNNPRKEIAVTLDQYGEPHIETVDVLPCQQRIARAVREEGETLSSEESFEMRKEAERQGKEFGHELAHSMENIEEMQKENGQTIDTNITAEDYIPNTGITWGDLMEDTGESLPKLIERYNREIEKEGIDSEDAVEIIEQDYGNVNRQHQH